PQEHESDHMSLLDKLRMAQSESPSGGISSEAYLIGIKKNQVEGIKDSIPFEVASRTPHIKRYPCAECHLPGKPPKLEVDNRKAHWDVTIQHADSKIMNCTTCHLSEQPDKLQLMGKQPLSFDHVYQLCAQ